MSRKGLRLRAADAEDVAMLSALLQDALIELPQIVFDPARKRFGGYVIRFCHEDHQHVPGAPMRQVKCALAFDGVTQVRYRGLDPAAALPLELLALSTDAGAAPRHATLHFAGGGALRVDFDRLAMRLEDIGDPWITAVAPSHEPGR
ncbi:MAG: DUF2948 family protein [Alphaproteobacteria bacterium]